MLSSSGWYLYRVGGRLANEDRGRGSRSRPSVGKQIDGFDKVPLAWLGSSFELDDVWGHQKTKGRDLGDENALEPCVLLLGSKMGNHLLRKMMGDF